MPTSLEWNSTVDPGEVVSRTRDALAAGGAVVLPGDAGYVALVNPAAADAVVPLDRLAGTAPPAVLANGPDDPAAFGLSVPEPVARLMARAWPAPLVIEFPAERATRPDWSPGVWERVTASGSIRFRSPDHPLFDAVVTGLWSGSERSGSELVTALVVETFLPTAADVAERLGDAAGLVVSAGVVDVGRRPTVLRCENGTAGIVEAGDFGADEIEKLAARIVLFVCTGNTCRSPLAEGLAKKLLADRLGCGVEELPGRGFWLLSAGTSAYGGGPATPEAAEVAAEMGADLSGHRSRPVNPQLLLAADDVIVMTQGHALALANQYGEYAPAARLLCGDGGDLEDPIGSGADVYRACAETIRRHLERIIAEWIGP